MFRHPWGINEDELTGDFFGLMKYLPIDVLLVPFINLIRSLYPDRKILAQAIDSAEILLWPEYQIPKEWRDQFNHPNIPAERRRSKYYIVPDVVISFNDYTLVVEAEKSHFVEAEQLFQQYMMGKRLFSAAGNDRKLFNILINTDQMPSYFCGVKAQDSRKGISILPDDSIPQYIVKRAEMLGETCDIDEVAYSYLWMSWHHVGRLAEEVLEMQRGLGNEISKLNARFLAGFKEMMDKEGFYPTPLFRANDPNEVSGEDCGSIPTLEVLPDWRDCSKDEELEPSLIPAFRHFGNLASWLAQLSICPETVEVVVKGGQ